jgi:Na+-driven multidrug efflux pump
VIAVFSPGIGLLFTGSGSLAALILPALIVLAIAQPVSGLVFVLDGVLIGAGDAKYLAYAGIANLVLFLPALGIVTLTGIDGTAGLAWLAGTFFVVYMCARLLTLGYRVRGTDWLRVGAA